MEFIQINRNKYISNNELSFFNNKDKNAYMSDWVATYEISDYMISQ